MAINNDWFLFYTTINKIYILRFDFISHNFSCFCWLFYLVTFHLCTELTINNVTCHMNYTIILRHVVCYLLLTIHLIQNILGRWIFCHKNVCGNESVTARSSILNKCIPRPKGNQNHDSVEILLAHFTDESHSLMNICNKYLDPLRLCGLTVSMYYFTQTLPTD